MHTNIYTIHIKQNHIKALKCMKMEYKMTKQTK